MAKRKPKRRAGGTLPSSPLRLGIVHGHGRVLFVAAGESEHVLHRLLAGYVAERSAVQLHPESEQRVRLLLDGGSPGEAVRCYFERVGERWDRESLTIVEVVPGAGRALEGAGWT
jgi:hypothetical protein